ncbi:MAG: hypothetical protein IKW62_01580 [Clostridia bacterium]|nr:hypothetical protein [Clostridia bacterium]
MSFDFQNKNIKDMGKESGKSFVNGLGVGMTEESYQAITAMENIYVELESLTKNAAKNAEKLEKKRQERQLSNLKNALNLELICEQEYYEKLKIFRDENLRQGTDAWYKCTEEIAKYNKRLFDETQKQYEKLIELRDDLSKKLQGGEPWLKTGTVRFKGLGQNGTDLVYNDAELKNFREEIQLLENYRDRLTELKNLGNVPEGVLADIAKMSVEDGLKAANAILLADERKRETFFSGYAKHQTTADNISAELLGILYGSELEAEGIGSPSDIFKGYVATGNKQQEDFVEILKASFEEVPESYYSLGEDAGGAFGEGFLSKIPEIMTTVRDYFTTVINQLAEQLVATLKQSAQNVVGGTSNTYNTTYTFNSSKDTTTQQLAAARNAATLQRLRGGNG